MQQGIWVASSQRPDSDPYIVVDLSRVHGDIDPAILRDSLGSLAERHEALRIALTVGDDPVQAISDSVSVDLEFLDLSRFPDPEREATRRVEERSVQRFDLTTAPLWRVALLRLSVDEHLLLLTIHHLICDEWSLNIMHSDLEAEYVARLEGNRSSLVISPDAPGFGDFAEWQAARFSSPAGERSLRYWLRAMKEMPRELDLPVDFSRTRGVTHKGHKAGWTPTADESRQFKELADRLGVSPFVLMATLFGIVLARHSGQRDITLGTAVSGRSSTESERMVGQFANLLPIPVRLGDTPTLAEATRRTKLEFLGLLDHQDIAFDRLVRELGAGRSDLRMPLCQATVSWSEEGGTAWALGPAQVEPVVRRYGSAKSEIALAGVHRRGGLEFELIGETSFFRTDTLQLLIDHFRAVVRAALSDPEASVLDLDLVGDGEAARLDRWSGSASRAGTRTTLSRLFEDAAAEFRDLPAVVDTESTFTYGRLTERADEWASRLRQLGVSTDTVVGVAIPRSAEMVAAVLGILRAGGAYLALNVDGPADYNAFCVAESAAAMVVATHGTTDVLGEVRCPVLLSEEVDGGSAAIEEPAVTPDETSTPDSLAFVSFTSGSSGTPKCVGITHENIVRIAHRSDWILHGPGATFVQLAPLGFDISAIELWACLLHGGRLVLPRHGRFDVPELASILHDESVTTWVTTTALFNQLVEQKLDVLGGVGQVLVGGEAAAPSVFDKVVSAQETRGVDLLNCYGPTENTCVTTRAHISTPVGAAVPIGTPVEGSTVYVLGPSLERVPVGVVGELYTGGVGVSRGYLNDPGLTAERFVPDSYGATPGARMYRTGDAVRWRADGQLEFVGRVDRQVKVRGFRIEPGEIEARLMEHPEVSAAVVVAQAGTDGHKQLLAYVVPVGAFDPAAEPARLRSFMAKSLPEHMIPSTITPLGRIPMTRHGKVDRDALPAPVQVHDGVRHRPPTTPTEILLAGAWRSVLGLDDVGVDANFFEVGGDSILSIRIAARVRESGIRLSSTDVFAAPTVSELAALVDGRRAGPATTAIVPEPSGEAVLSPIQHWFVNQFGPENHFNQSVWLRSDQPLDETLLQDALEALVQHHDSLRLRLLQRNGRWVQAVGPATAPDLAVVEVQGSPHERGKAIEKHSAELQRSLDVQEGSLIRSLLVPDISGRDDLIIVAHHLAVDTVSWDVLARHLELAYRQLEAGRTPTLPSETISFIDWTAALNRAAASGEAETAAQRWQELERRRTQGAITGSHDRGTVAQAGHVRAELGESATQNLLRRPIAACSVDIKTVLLTALARTLADWAGGSEWIIDMEGHGRDALGSQVDLSETLGWFTALFPVGLAIAMNDSVEEQLRSIHGQLDAQPPGHTYGTSRYMKQDQRLQPAGSSDVSFNYHGQMIEGAEKRLLHRIGGGIGGDIGADLQRLNGFEWNSAVEAGQLRVRLSYPARRFAEPAMQDVVDRFVHHCQVIADAF